MKALQGALPALVRDILSTPPRRGEGLNVWFYRAARALHPFRTEAEIVRLLAAATAGPPVKRDEIERAVANSAATAQHPRRLATTAPASRNSAQRRAEQGVLGGIHAHRAQLDAGRLHPVPETTRVSLVSLPTGRLPARIGPLRCSSQSTG